jgi:hypothetical protein
MVGEHFIDPAICLGWRLFFLGRAGAKNQQSSSGSMHDSHNRLLLKSINCCYQITISERISNLISGLSKKHSAGTKIGEKS